MSVAKTFQFGAKAAAIKEISMLKKKKSAKKKTATKKKATASTNTVKKNKPALKKKVADTPAPATTTQRKISTRAPKLPIPQYDEHVIDENLLVDQNEDSWDDDEDYDEDRYYDGYGFSDDDEDDEDWDDDDEMDDEDEDEDEVDADDDGFQAGSSGGMHYNHDGWWHYEPAAPIAVRGGIKARSVRGAFAVRWWGKRWIDTLESFHIGARLTRGKSYARSGQVSSLQIGGGNVRALVQGTRKTPYAITIRLRAFTPEEWTKILRKLRSEPIHAVRLLNGEMPEELEDLVKKTGVPLFPERHADLDTDCSCPDYSNPCKHIAAVYYILAEALDDDPFLLLRMRGMDRDQLLNMLKGPTSTTAASPRTVAPSPLPVEPASFWEWNPAKEILILPATPIHVNAALPKRLGAIPFWRSSIPFLESMEAVYETASLAAADWVTEDTPAE